MTKKLDKVCSDIIRARGYCVKCGGSGGQLQTAHIFSRKNRAVRWDLDNLLTLDAKCHFWAHQNPIFFTEWVKEYLGEYQYSALKYRALMIKQWTLEELQDLFKTLQKVRNDAVNI